MLSPSFMTIGKREEKRSKRKRQKWAEEKTPESEEVVESAPHSPWARPAHKRTRDPPFPSRDEASFVVDNMAIPPADDETVKTLCITPISTTDITASLARLHPSTPALAITFIDGRGLANCPPSINDDDEAAQSTAAILPRAVDRIRSSAPDAVLVCCFSDHPLVAALTRTFPGLPVTGILQAALQESTTTRNGRFGIVTTSLAWEPALRRSVEHLGFAAGSAGVVSTGLGVLELGGADREVVVRRIVEACKPLADAGAESIVLGCAGMAPLEADIRAALPPGVATVDGVRAGIEVLARLARERPRVERTAALSQEAKLTCEI